MDCHEIMGRERNKNKVSCTSLIDAKTENERRGILRAGNQVQNLDIQHFFIASKNVFCYCNCWFFFDTSMQLLSFSRGPHCRVSREVRK